MSVHIHKKFFSGFTLIELLVVMAILGILAPIGLVSFRTAQIKGRDAVRKHDLEQIQRALEMYYNDVGSYPLAEEGEIKGCGSRTNIIVCSWGSPWQFEGTLYIKELPGDKRQSYCYDSTDGTDYKLYAKLENTQDPDCLEGDCSTARTCGGKTYNYGISSGTVSP